VFVLLVTFPLPVLFLSLCLFFSSTGSALSVFFFRVLPLSFSPPCSSAVLDIYRQENALAPPRVIVQPLG
jgi:hypothetical protein